MDQYEEIQLMDYLNVIWKRKWLIIIPTFILVLAVGIISFLLPRRWEIDAIIQPSKFFIQTEQGEFKEVFVADSKQVAGQINQKSYDNIIAAELNIDIREFPKLRAENLRDTKLVRIAVREKDIDQGKKILASLFNYLKIEFDKKINVELGGIETQIDAKKNQITQSELNIKENENQIALKRLQIRDRENEIVTKENEIKKKNNDIKIKDLDVQSKEIEKDRTKQEIESSRNKLKISEDRVKSILEEMKLVKKRIDDLDEQLKKAISERKQGGDAVSLLLYSNEVQQNLRYYNTLDEKLSTEKITQQNLLQEIKNKEEQLRQIDTQISQVNTQKDTIKTEIDDIQTEIKVIKTEIEKIYNQIATIKNDIEKIKSGIIAIQSEIKLLENKKVRLDYAQLIKEPTSSLSPVSPKKKVNVAVAGFLGLFLFTMLAFFVEYIEKQKVKNAQNP